MMSLENSFGGNVEQFTVKENAPIFPESFVLLSPDKALGCPNCGAVTAVDGSSGASACRFCSSELLPQEDAYSQTIADRSHFLNCQPYPQALKRYPGLEILGNNGARGYDLLQRIDANDADNIVSILEMNKKVLHEQRRYVEREFFELVFERQRLLKSIIDMPDDQWRVSRGIDNYVTEGDSVVATFAHPNGTYSMIRASTREWTGRKGYIKGKNSHDVVYLELTKLRDDPKSAAEFNSLVLKNDYERPKSVQETVIEEENWYFETEKHVTAGSKYQHDAQLQLLLDTMPSQRDIALLYFEKALGLTDSDQKPNYSQWKQLISVQEMWFAQAIKDKLKRIKEKGPESTQVIGEPKIDAAKAQEIDSNYYINSGLAEAKTAMALACENCGGALAGYEAQKSFLTCGFCNSVTDIVKSGRVSPEMLSAREYGDTVLPFGYFAELLIQQEHNDKKVADADPVDAQSVIDQLMEETLPQGAEKDEVFFAVVNALIKTMRSNPHLLASLNYQGSYDHKYGFSMSVDIGNQPSLVVSTPKGVVNISVPESIRGKILVFKVSDFDRPMFSGQDFTWCRLQSGILSKEEIDGLKSAQEWEDRLSGWNLKKRDNHWLDQTDGIMIGSGINYDVDTPLDRKSGRYYEMVLDTMTLIPEGSDLSNLINKPVKSKKVEVVKSTLNLKESQPVAVIEPYVDARGRVRSRSPRNKQPATKVETSSKEVDTKIHQEKTSSLWSRLYKRLRGNN